MLYVYWYIGLSIHHLKQGESDIPNSRTIQTLKMQLQEIMRGNLYFIYLIKAQFIGDPYTSDFSYHSWHKNYDEIVVLFVL